MILDRATILALSALVSIVMGAILLAAQGNGRLGTWATCWGLGNVAFGLSNVNQALKGVVPDGLLVSGENVVGIVGYGLIVQGARLLAGRKPRWAALAIVLVALAVPLAIANLPEHKPARVAYNNIAFIVGDLWVALEAVRLARQERLNTGWILAGLFAVTVPFSGVRLSVALSTIAGTDTLDNARVGTWLAALLAAFWSIRGALPALIIAERATQKLARLACHDALTGALNRVGLDRLRPALNGPVAAVMIDLDHFKLLNDRYGHAQGDAVLRLLADTVNGRRRDGDGFVRLGGDEFLLLLPNTTAEDAGRVGEAIRAGFAAAMAPLAIAAPSPTISIGIACGDLAGCDLEPLLSEADKVLYLAKNGGRDRVSVQTLAA